MSSLLRLVVAGVVVSTAATLTAPASAVTLVGDQPSTEVSVAEAGSDQPTRAQARAALSTVESLFAPRPTGTYTMRAVPTAAATEPTMALRELREALPALTGDDAARARSLLARPTSADAAAAALQAPASSDCTEHVCVHWVGVTRDAVPALDSDDDGVPNWVRTTQQVLEQSWQHYVDAGYREPLSDEDGADHGPDGRVDVYLADIASLGFYGYCTGDVGSGVIPRRQPGFCVLDNDYAYEQVSTEPVVALRASAAHELFHLVQFAYDSREDAWLMEGTAAWMEDEVFDDANDNWNYLPFSTLAHPNVPIDYGQDYFEYGAWSWWRFLSEYLGTDRKPAPGVVRRIWETAGADERDVDSLTATRRVLAQLGVPFGRAFRDYSALSHVSRRWYFEGAQAPYPQAPMARRLTLTKRSPGTGAYRTLRLHHLTSANVALTRKGTWARSGRLRVSVDAPPRVTAPAAEVTIHYRDGRLAWRTVPLDADGNGSVTVGFVRAKVSRVVLTLVNASTRTTCRQDTVLACGGIPRDDGRAFRFKARAVR